MNKAKRDLAVELFNKHGLNPEDIMSDGSITVCDKDKGIHTSFVYKELANITSGDVLSWETNQK